MTAQKLLLEDEWLFSTLREELGQQFMHVSYLWLFLKTKT